ncbi:BlaI/MecI/CopY family transcriptional regulator [Streptomyces venezuelae]|uniref:BlaI/MecI/CopY family transcriptional regulator n=1 Tax=Streptomyces venezuelae TaxID=54571 RepID=UPI0034422D7D
MSDVQPETPGMQAQYAARVAADLETNRKEQERIGAEVAALQEQLQALENDHAVLLSMQQALGSPDTATGDTKQSARRKKAVPAPRTSTNNSRATRSKKTAVAAKDKAATDAPKTTAKRSATPKASSKATPKASSKAAPKTGPTLVELIADHLGQQQEPRSAAEIATALDKALPDRTVKTTVVRTTVEGLVAKGRVQRSKQGSSVFYTSTTSAERPAATEPETETSAAN